MNKNKLVIAMAAAALMSSMGAVANDADSFIAKYIVDDEITIQILEDEVALTSSSVDPDDGFARGSTEFCVGRLGADLEGGNGDFTVTVTSANTYQLAQGDERLPYQLHYTADNIFAEDDLINADADTIEGTTTLNLATCDTNQAGNGYMWVSVPPSSMDAAVSGTYTDTVTMTVAPRS